MPLLALLAAALLAASLLTGAGSVSAEGKPPDGDVDCSGFLSSVDAALILQFHAALVDTLPCEQNADANRDGVINSIDAALLLQFNAWDPPKLPP
ncbi:MAG: dockerin type I repeat-containing protein [Dehalococcoidia bacterium]|nr:dockerin type I repeat-containing protein [Dehalococcoidia bacterium]